MSLDRQRRRRPRLPVTPSRIVQKQRLRRPVPAPDQPKPSWPKRALARLGSWNWTAFASLIAAGAAAFGLIYTGRSLDATHEQNETIKQSQLTDRFTKAVDQLDRAGLEHLQARLGAIYALERLAGDSQRDHPTVVEVLSAFIRTTTPQRISAPAEVGITTPESPKKCPDQQAAADIQAALTVLGSRNTARDRKSPWRLDLSDVCLRGADLTGANLAGVRLGGTDLTGADLSYADLADADLFNADLPDAYLAYAYLPGADLNSADLTDANLHVAYLHDADLPATNLTGAILSGAVLSDANLHVADLSGAYLRDANLTGADLHRADLTDAYLDGAYLNGADLSDADLTGAFLTGANLTGAHFNSETDVTDVVIDEMTQGVWW